MKAGLFICDHVKPQYVGTFGDYPKMFAELFPELDWVIFDVFNNQFPDDLNLCDVYMATGSAHSVYEDIPWIKMLQSTIAQLYTLNKKFIGVCFGHQLIAESLGGKVEKSDYDWCVGVHEFSLIDKKEWMIPDADKFNLLMMCQDQVVVLPPHTQVLAGAERCPNGIIQVGEHFLGIQAHPEYAKGFDQALMELRRDKIGEALFNQGIESMRLPLNADVIKEWVLRFINYE